jgi:hypothetical protein
LWSGDVEVRPISSVFVAEKTAGWFVGTMARRLRIQYPNAIYHVMTRGNGRQDIAADDVVRGRLEACLERAVKRSGWVLHAFVDPVP